MKTSDSKNCEANFVFRNVFEFINAWESGKDSKLLLESTNGKAWVNFSCYLGAPLDQHVKPKAKRRKSSHRMERDNEPSKEAAPASVTPEDIADVVNAVSAVQASEAETGVSDSDCIRSESMHAFMYIHSEQPKIDSCHIETKDLVKEFVDDTLRDYSLSDDTKIQDIKIECENKKVRGGKYVGFQTGQVPFDKDFDMDDLKNISGRPYVFKVGFKVKYQQKLGNNRPFAVAFKDIVDHKDWLGNRLKFSPENDVFVSFGGCWRMME